MVSQSPSWPGTHYGDTDLPASASQMLAYAWLQNPFFKIIFLFEIQYILILFFPLPKTHQPISLLTSCLLTLVVHLALTVCECVWALYWGVVNLPAAMLKVSLPQWPPIAKRSLARGGTSGATLSSPLEF